MSLRGKNQEAMEFPLKRTFPKKMPIMKNLKNQKKKIKKNKRFQCLNQFPTTQVE